MSNGLDFERQVHALLKNMGFEAEITKASGDGGIDIIAHSQEHITGGKYIIQCKDWSKPVGEPPVRDLYGVVTAENANKGILITTSTFTSPAINFAAGKPLELIDGAKFNQLLSKYSLGSLSSDATADDARIKVLTDRINKNPKDILAMKELADIHLLHGDYNRSVELYETLISLKEFIFSVNTEKFINAYTCGQMNYAVALAKLKRYDEALNEMLTFAQATLAHYLGLFDIAASLYKTCKAISDDPDCFDEDIEKAYLQMPLDNPSLSVRISKDGIDEWWTIHLETPRIKSMSDGNLYRPLMASASEIENEYLSCLQDLINCVGGNSHSHSEEIAESYKKLFQLMYRAKDLISEYGYVVAVTTESPLQEACKQVCIALIDELTLISAGLEKDINSLDDIKTLVDEYCSINNKVVERRNALDIEIKNVEDKYETLINQEKTEWREKLRNTLYANWTPQPSNTASPQPQNKQCFIATAVYGSPFSPEVEALRQWRDRSLSTTVLGHSFISSYYKYSPRIADYIKERALIKRLIKKALDGVVWIVGRQDK